MPFVLSNQAESDVRDILRYTEEVWGRTQRLTYSNMIEDAFTSLSNNPLMGRSCTEIRSNYCKYHVGKHTIFYKQLNANDIEIVRVLHERMNFELHFQ